MITVADPIIRFHNLITVPQHDLVETGQSEQAWRRWQPSFVSRILGPHFEECARDWLRGHADPAVRGGVGQVATTAAVVAVFSMEGFRPSLVEAARHRNDVLLVDLPTLFGLEEPLVSPITHR